MVRAAPSMNCFQLASRFLFSSKQASHMPRALRLPSIRTHGEQPTMELALPSTITAEMVTISTAKGDKLRIVADAWHLESDCTSSVPGFPQNADFDRSLRVGGRVSSKGREYEQHSGEV